VSPSLPLFANLRRYTLAVVAAAETAANHAGVMQTTVPPNGEASEVEAGATLTIERNQMTALPEGWTLSQMKAEQPTGTYGEFKHEIINEAARPLNMPFNIAAGNSSGYNYSSGRLDHQTYFKSVGIEQDDLEIEALDRIFDAWIAEAILIEGYLPQAARAVGMEFDHEWFWDGVGQLDEVKSATAQEKRLANLTSTLADEYAREGKDWETAVEQIAREDKKLSDLGITRQRAAPAQQPAAVPAGTEPDDDEELDDNAYN
jgi:capsid protein